MSETLRPWLRQYTLEHAQNEGLNLDAAKAIVRICQLIHFRTYEVNEDPNGPPGGLWAEISDGQWHIPVHIPAHSVDAIVRANGSAMTKLTGGIFRVSPMAFLCQCLPVNRTAIERDTRLALRVDVKEYVGSAGENTFKDPRPIMDDSTVRTWVRALRGDHDALQSFSSAVTEALLEEEQRRKANVARKPSRNGSTVVAGLIPRERERAANQHHHKNSNPSRSVKIREKSKKEKGKERSVKERGLAEYRTAWGKRSLKMKWYLVPDEQCEILNRLEFPADEEAVRGNLASRPGHPLPAQTQRNRDALDLSSMTMASPFARMTAVPSSPPLHELPSSLPTQTATSAPSRPMSPELGPPEAVDNDDDDVQIDWPSSPPAPGRNDEQDQFVFATPRPPTQPVILVPNSDPSSRATNSQSQSIAHGSQSQSQSQNSHAHGSQSHSVAQSSQQSRSPRRNASPPPTNSQQQQQPRSSAAPTHVSDTVLEHSSAPQPPADGNDSLTQSTSQSLSQPQPAQEQEQEPQPKPEAVLDSVTESTESQSQPQPAPAEVQVAMDVDIPEPEPEPELEPEMTAQSVMDEDDAVTEAFLASAMHDNDHGGRTTRKRAREDETSRLPGAKRARRSAEAQDEDGDARPAAVTATTTRESSTAASLGRSARKTVDKREKNSKLAKRLRGDSDARASSSKGAGDERRVAAVGPEPVQPHNHASSHSAKRSRDDSESSSSKRAVAVESDPVELADKRQGGLESPAAEPPDMPVKTESPSPVHGQKRSSEIRLPVPDDHTFEEEGRPIQPPHLTLPDVMDMFLRLGQRRQRAADDKAKNRRDW